MTRESQCRSQSDMKLQERDSNLKTVDGLLEVPSEVEPNMDRDDKSKTGHRHSQSQPILKN